VNNNGRPSSQGPFGSSGTTPYPSQGSTVGSYGPSSTLSGSSPTAASYPGSTSVSDAQFVNSYNKPPVPDREYLPPYKK